MVVVDVTVQAYILIEGDQTKRVSRLLEREPVWVAPRLWRDELINVLCTYERLEKADRSENLRRLALAEQLVSKTYDIPADIILEMAKQTGCSGYDSQYLALASELRIPLFTFDKQILSVAPGIALRP